MRKSRMLKMLDELKVIGEFCEYNYFWQFKTLNWTKFTEKDMIDKIGEYVKIKYNGGEKWFKKENVILYDNLWDKKRGDIEKKIKQND